MALYFNSTDIKFANFNGTVLTQINYNGTPVWYSGANVTYVVDTSTSYTEWVNYGNSCLSPTSFTPTKSGYTFVGWREDTTASSTVLTSKTMETEAITLYAVFALAITLSYDGNGSTSGSTSAQTGTVYYNNGNVAGVTFTVASNSYVRTNYAFLNWTLGSTSGTAYAAGASITLTASNTMYAAWAASYKSYGYTGAVQSFTAEVAGLYLLDIYGAGNPNAQGGHTWSYVTLTKGQTIYIACGGYGSSDPGIYHQDSYGMWAGGWNGGGYKASYEDSSSGGGGGGATHIATTNRGIIINYASYTGELLVVAGGASGHTTGKQTWTDDDGGWHGASRETKAVSGNGGYGGGFTSEIPYYTGGGYGKASVSTLRYDNEDEEWKSTTKDSGTAYYKNSSVTYGGATYSSGYAYGGNSSSGVAYITLVAR